MSSENDNRYFDVTIAGAGPAGCAAAIALAQAGFRVALLDPAEVPQHKVGESLPAAIIRLLRRLGIQGIPDLLAIDQYKSCVANASAWGSDSWTYQDGMRNLEGLGWQINRSAFEVALRQKAIQAGAVFKMAKVTQVVYQNGGYHCQLKTPQQSIQLSTKWLIDATGRSSKIARLLDLKKTQFSEQMAAIAWVQTQGDTDATTRIKSVENGWWYSAALPRHKRVLVFHGLAESVRSFIQQPDLFITHFNKSQTIAKKLTTNQLVTKVSGREASVFKLNLNQQPNFLAVGDAILSFDPLSSQGVFFALYSGVRAADLIIEQRNNATDSTFLIQQYQATVEQIFLKNQATRQAFYHQEYRYQEQAYWQRQTMFNFTKLTC